jgi:hydroxymethylpyrimidine pyrophosphatase-like HAD family hydrolase
MIKEASRDNVTAAIGDGGNDISMIQGKRNCNDSLDIYER